MASVAGLDMAITKLPSSLHTAELLTCAICGVGLALDKATAGMYDSERRQTFACVSHFYEVEKLILGWAEFTAKERYKSLHQSQGLQELFNETGGHHARPDC